MANSRLPDSVYPSIFDLDAAYLAGRGIRLLLADLDNTLVPYAAPQPTDAVRAWADELSRNGIRLFILSNNRTGGRAERFCSSLGVPFISRAGKPRRKSFSRAMDQMGAAPEETAIVGDQFFTDGWGGKRAGISVLLVRPLELKGNPLRALRYLVELPFRAFLFQKGRSAIA